MELGVKVMCEYSILVTAAKSHPLLTDLPFLSPVAVDCKQSSERLYQEEEQTTAEWYQHAGSVGLVNR